MAKSNISEEDIFFLESWYTPACLLESLFHDFDNLTAYKKGRFGEIRLYQQSMVSDESIIDFELTASERGLNKKRAFELKKNVGDIYCFGARKFGKCEDENSLCQLSNGTRVPFKDLVNKKVEVISLNQDTWKLEPAVASFFDNGIKDCVKVTLNSGKANTVTENHPFLTQRGWTMAKDLRSDDFLATPHNYGHLGKVDIDPKIAALLGYLIGDGGCSQPHITFTNIDKKLIEEVYELAEHFDCALKRNNVTYGFRNKIYKVYEKNKVYNLVKEYKIDTLSKHKRIPTQVFTWNNKNIALLLNRLYACDGSVYKNNTVNITLASLGLIQDIQHLLLRFGIASKIYYKQVKFNNKLFDAWVLAINSYVNAKRFIEQIGIKTKEHKFDLNKKSLFKTDFIPNHFFSLIEDKLAGFKKKFKTRNIKYYNVSSEKWQRIAKATNDPAINKIAFSDIQWEKIVKLENIQEVKTVMVSVPKNNTYISNDIISHNSMCVETLDLLNTMLTSDTGEKCAFSSVDLLHLRQILDPIKDCFADHPIAKIFKSGLKGSPEYCFKLKNNYVLNSVNYNLGSTSPGRQWFGKHVYRVYNEEASLETEEVYEKRKSALSEVGAVFRSSGMTDFTPYSPPGKAFYKFENKKHVLNYPQFCNPFWDEKEKQEKIEEYGGENSIGYRVFVKGEVVEDGVSTFDMKRVRDNCYMVDRKGNFTKDIKRFDITKENFPHWKNLIVTERPINSDRIFICSDIGKRVTEIIVVSEVNDDYEPLYNIVLYNLTQQEVETILKHLIERLKANVIGIDCGDGEGRGIYDGFELIYPKANLVYYQGSKKLPVGFETDEAGDILLEKNEPVYKQEFMSEFSVQRLKHLFYHGRVRIPKDYKFETQFSVVVGMTSGTRTVYRCISQSGDHYFDAWRVFAIAQWLKKDFNDTKEIDMSNDWGTGAVS